ncbi:carbon-nitrogen hydrolase family protein [Alterisphingorhabdus coralli]|uniref:Carbon-nitrogen hydrolase family protein n=1 Tax=Alterisphingorhabdus coralli TaxID=3071408 RepID=A0AA97F625_9SPHN|nr:carbon-nitrogen hydrolase family protein [Parasphingorhabdus sp. SCSIO 66989]WOE73973.1 carbon-nitrogen hydrolase family protein [Parasphingorhabdus sp. SCSIO 66989]
MPKTLTAAIVQAAPVPLAIGDGINQLIEHIDQAAKNGAQLIAFGETFLGGYPLWLDEASDAALWDHPGSKALHRIMLDNAIVEGDPRLEPVQELVDRHDVMVSVGAHQRIRNSLYNNQMLFRPGQHPLNHRKLVPTHGERLIWMRGDGSTLETHCANDGTMVGSLICWENWMPLARAAMHNQGEQIHVAAWPTVRESYSIASRHYAFEGRCFVLAAGTVQHRDNVLEGLERAGGNAEARALLEQMPEGQLQRGNSQIIAPDTEILAEAGSQSEVISAELDLNSIGEGLASLDVDGHYSRPDVFELSVNRRPQDGVVWQS